MASKYKNHKQILSAVRGIIVYSVNPDVASQEETEISFLGASKAALLRPFELMKKGGVIAGYELIETRCRPMVKRLSVIVRGINMKIASLDVIKTLLTQQLQATYDVKYCKSFDAFINLKV